VIVATHALQELEKDPLAEVPSEPSELLDKTRYVRSSRDLGAAKEAEVSDIIHKISSFCEKRGLVVKPYFDDAAQDDNSSKLYGHVTHTQFKQCLDVKLGLNISASQVTRLCTVHCRPRAQPHMEPAFCKMPGPLAWPDACSLYPARHSTGYCAQQRHRLGRASGVLQLTGAGGNILSSTMDLWYIHCPAAPVHSLAGNVEPPPPLTTCLGWLGTARSKSGQIGQMCLNAANMCVLAAAVPRLHARAWVVCCWLIKQQWGSNQLSDSMKHARVNQHRCHRRRSSWHASPNVLLPYHGLFRPAVGL
jgi:hypothetical protein